MQLVHDQLQDRSHKLWEPTLFMSNFFRQQLDISEALGPMMPNSAM